MHHMQCVTQWRVAVLPNNTTTRTATPSSQRRNPLDTDLVAADRCTSKIALSALHRLAPAHRLPNGENARASVHFTLRALGGPKCAAYVHPRVQTQIEQPACGAAQSFPRAASEPYVAVQTHVHK
jgi:hypothetical protein